jgi:hypothetical protein
VNYLVNVVYCEGGKGGGVDVTGSNVLMSYDTLLHLMHLF